MHIQSIKDRAVKLRKEGFSYAHISSKLSVAKSTLSLWLRGVPFIPNELIVGKIRGSNRKLIQAKRVDKIASLSQASIFAEHAVGKLSSRDLFILGIGIYIGEGSKVGNFIRIANSDPRIIRFSMFWLKKCFNLAGSNFKIRIHMYPDHDEKKILKFWMKALKVKKDAFYPSSFDRRRNKGLRNRGMLPYGTAHLSVVSNGDKKLGVLLHRKILASIDSVLK